MTDRIGRGAHASLIGLAALAVGVQNSNAQGPIIAVETESPAGAALRESFDQAGATWVGLLSTHRVLLRGDELAIMATGLARTCRVLTWQDKAHQSLLDALGQASPSAPGVMTQYVVMPSISDPAARRRIATEVRRLGGTTRRIDSASATLGVTINPLGLRGLLAHDDVLWAEPFAAPHEDDDFVRDFGGANYVEQVSGFTGAGVVLEVMDGGILQTHADFADRPPVMLSANTTSTSHGTAAYGVIFGDGASDDSALGLAPSATGYFSAYSLIDDRDAHLALFASSPINGSIQTNSWGSGITRRYSTASAEMDASILRHGVTIFQSQSNLGGPDARPEAWAKNIISVGGVQGRGTLSRDDDTWGGLASTGPGLDGRVKPDLVMFNDGIWTTGHESPTHHRSFTGTSAATPAVAGHAAVLVEMWRSGHFHGGDQTWKGRLDEFTLPALDPSVSMIRALLINTAKPYEFNSVADDLGRFRQGWGTPDLRALHDRAASLSLIDQAVSLAEGDALARVYTRAGSSGPLRVTMVYADPPGLAMAHCPTVNDLDLRVTSPTGTVYHGNHGLHDGVWSLPGGAADAVNTVENVLIETPEQGHYLVEVIARRIVEDADLRTEDLDATFALVVSGVRDTTTPALAPVGDLPGRLNPDGGEVLRFRPVGFTATVDGVARFGQSAVPVPLTLDADGLYSVVVPALSCDSVLAMRFEATAGIQAVASFPPGSGSGALPILAATTGESVPDPTTGWATERSTGLYTGGWAYGTPAGGGLRWDPAIDGDGDGRCWLTDNRAGNSDVSNGTVTLVTPSIPVGLGSSPRLEMRLWLASDEAGEPGEDTLLVEASTDEGASWQTIAVERSTFRWVDRAYELPAVGSPVTARFRFSVSDGPDESITEAAIDGLRISWNDCPGCDADHDGDGSADLDDLSLFVAQFQAGDLQADFDGDGSVSLTDLLLFLVEFNLGC